MKKTTLAILAYLFTIFSFSQVNVGTGTTVNEEMPIEPYYKFSYSQVIYTADEINASGSITGLKYTATAETTLANSNGWEIWLGHTSLSFHPVDESDIPSWVDISELTQVFAGTVSIADQIVEITFDIPFEYNGTDNLIIAVNETSNVNDDYDENNNDFYCTPTPGIIRGIVSYTDSDFNNPVPIDPSNPPVLYAYDVRQSFANVTFEGISQSCQNPAPAVVESIGELQYAFLWPSNDLNAEFLPSMDPDVELTSSTSGIPLSTNQQIFIDDEDGVPVGYYNPTINVGLEPTTEYVFYARTVCDGEYSAWVPTYYTTGCSMYELPFSESFENDSLTWECWTVEDLSPEGAAANNSWTPIAGNGFDGSYSAYLWTLNNQGKNQDYMISPQLNLSGNDRIKFSVMSFPNTDEVNSMSVLLSTTTNNPEDFTVVLSETTQYPGSWTEVSIDLSAYSGPVYIAFYVPPTSTEGHAIYVDGVIVEENPVCDAPLSVTLDNVTSESAQISWGPGASQETQWEYVLQEAGADQPIESGTLIDTSSILLEGLVQGAEYDFYVRAACDGGSFSSYVPNNGVYFMIPPVGGICNDPIVIESFPFSVTDDTINYQDDYDGAPGDAESCSTASSYMSGDDVFYSFTAPYDMPIIVTFDPVNTWSGIFVYDSCDSIGVSCIAGSASSSADERIFELDLYENQTYLIAISTFPSPQSTPFELTIVEDSCDPPVVEVSNLPCDENQNFLVEVNISDMGSSSQYNIFDDLGNEQVVESSGILTFGPYNGNQQIFIQGDDPNCFQDFDINTICNDECTGAFAIDPGEIVNGDTNLATDSGNNPSNDLWYSYTGNGEADNVTVSLCGSSYDTYLRVFDACDGTQISFNDDSCSTQSELTFDSDGTTTYYIMVEGYSSYNGEFVLNISSTLGVNDYQLVGLKIYPNPADGNYVTINSPISGDKFINLFDINGRKVLSTTLVGDMLDISSFNAGFYVIEVIVGNYKKVSKLVIE
jgi:hypothetical protein